MKPLLISSGEPAGVGPDLCLALAQIEVPVVVLGDLNLLEERARSLNLKIQFNEYETTDSYFPKDGSLSVIHIPVKAAVQAGQLNELNTPYVMELLTKAAQFCKNGDFSALVTAPVHKAVINKGGYEFSGHTEFLQEFYNVPQVVMMLTCASMKVALVTTHLPLSKVPNAITKELVVNVIKILDEAMKRDFGIINPLLKVAGLNPHAGESGYLGMEEIDIISPALEDLIREGISLQGPLPADTMFVGSESSKCDAYVCMYHDQGLPVIKYAGFYEAVNVTLGLPIVRTSVDHGTALELAGTGKAHAGSMKAAVELAYQMAKNRNGALYV